MYSLVLMAAMTSTAEAPAFGSVWAKHCFWECCLPARYGWVACGPGYAAYYPAAYNSCYGGCHGHGHGCYSCSGCGGCYGGCCGGCYGGCCGGCYGGCRGCYGGCGGCWGGCGGGCIGGYYNCYGGGPGGGAWGNLWSGIGYAGFGAYGNYGNYNTIPVYSSPVFTPPAFGTPPFDGKIIEPKPKDYKPSEIKPLDTPPLEIRPLKTMSEPAKASVVVKVPSDAKVYVDGHLMKSTSTERTFMSPAIEPGASFYYVVRVVAQKNGKEVEDIRRVTVKAGEVSRLAFDNLFDRLDGDERRTVVNATRP